MHPYFKFLKELDFLRFKRDLEMFSDSADAQELNAKAMNVPRSADHRSGDFCNHKIGVMHGKPRSIGHGPVTNTKEPPRLRQKVIGEFYVTICAFDVMHELAQSEFEKAVLLKREVAKDFILLPFINHYLARTVFFAQLSQQTNNITHLNKAYKRAHLVCMVIKYFLKDKHSTLEPSAQLIAAMRKGLYL